MAAVGKEELRNAGEQDFLRAWGGFQKSEHERLQAIESKKYEFEKKVQAIREEAEGRNEEVRRFQASFEAAESQAVASYFMVVLARSSYPPRVSSKCEGSVHYGIEAASGAVRSPSPVRCHPRCARAQVHQDE